MPQDITPRQAALWFAAQGHAVLPLHSITDAGDCTCGNKCDEVDAKTGRLKTTGRGKHPFEAFAPNGLNSATADPAVVAGWFDEYYWLSYGISCAQLLVIDVDPRHGGDDKWSELCRVPTRPLISTWMVITGKYDAKRGRHVMFKNPGIRRGKLDQGIDIQGAGAYIVGPCCPHHTGVRYQWLPQQSPADVPLADPPAWLLTAIKTQSHCGRPQSLQDWRTVARTRLTDGDRHNGLNRLIGHFIGIGADPIMVRDMMLGWNLGMCDGPIPDKEVITAVANIATRELDKQQWLPKDEDKSNDSD